MRSLTVLVCVLSLSAVAVAGCGSGDTASSADSVVPAAAVMYGEVELAPEGGQQKALNTLVAKFPGEGSLGNRIRGLLDDALAEADRPLSYKNDVEPWLGDQAGFFVAGVGNDGDLQSGAVMVATDDEDASREALEKAVKGDSRERSYNDVDYLVSTSDDTAGGVVDGFLVIGTERALKSVIDTSDGGSPLADDETFDEATSDIPEQRLGLVYLNSPKLFDVAQRGAGAAQLEVLRDLFKEPYVTTVVAERDGVVFEGDAPESLSKVVPFLGQGSDVINELPGDSWLALSQPDFGKLLEFYVDAFAAGFGGRDVIENQLRSATGLDLQADVLGWMGDFGLFVRGTSVADLDGGLVVQTTDPAATERFLSRLGQLTRAQGRDSGTRVEPLSAPGGGEGFSVRDDELPQPIHVFLRGERFVAAYGDQAAQDALDPPETLGDAAAFSAAAGSLDGYKPAFFLDMVAVLSLVDSTPLASDPQWAQVRPYLEPLTALIGGTSGDGDDLSQAFKIYME
jgi:Protein of unknown function (DUF3352)